MDIKKFMDSFENKIIASWQQAEKELELMTRDFNEAKELCNTLAEALEICRGQWIHSVNAERNLAALEEYEKLKNKFNSGGAPL